jgi:F0F1-type ATP synthase delta subunit
METLDLSSFCRTKAQARDFSSRLAEVSGKVYQTDFQLESALSSALGIQKRDAFLKLVSESGASLQKPAEIKTLLTKLQEQVAALPVLSLVIAFEPTEQTLKILTDWFLLNTKRQILFDISVDPNLVAGVAIKFNGRYAEYSIKPAVIKIIREMANKPAIPAQQAPQPAVPAPKHPELFSLGR